MAWYSPAVISVPFAWRITLDMVGLDKFPSDEATSSSTLEHSNVQSTSRGYWAGRIAGWCKYGADDSGGVAIAGGTMETESLGARDAVRVRGSMLVDHINSHLET